MKKILFLISVLVMASCGAARPSAVNEEPISVRIGSYNLWISTLGKGDNAWELRKSRLVQSIVEADMDIFGTQELDTRIQEELPVLFLSHQSLAQSQLRLYLNRTDIHPE